MFIFLVRSWLTYRAYVLFIISFFSLSFIFWSRPNFLYIFVVHNVNIYCVYFIHVHYISQFLVSSPILRFQESSLFLLLSTFYFALYFYLGFHIYEKPCVNEACMSHLFQVTWFQSASIFLQIPQVYLNPKGNMEASGGVYYMEGFFCKEIATVRSVKSFFYLFQINFIFIAKAWKQSICSSIVYG